MSGKQSRTSIVLKKQKKDNYLYNSKNINKFIEDSKLEKMKKIQKK